MRLENTWQEIRDHSFIQNLSRSFRFTAPWRCFFSSVHLTHFLQGSGQRTGPETQSFSTILQLWSLKSLWPLKFSSYRHTSSSRQIHNIFCWLEMINYCPDGGNGNFHCSSSFLKATSLICEAQLCFAAHQKYILWFFSLWWVSNLEFGLCFPSYLYFCETGSHGWIISCS